MSVQTCPTPCDVGCDAGCHEVHQVSFKREHEVTACPSRQWEPYVHDDGRTCWLDGNGVYAFRRPLGATGPSFVDCDRRH